MQLFVIIEVKMPTLLRGSTPKWTNPICSWTTPIGLPAFGLTPFELTPFGLNSIGLGLPPLGLPLRDFFEDPL